MLLHLQIGNVRDNRFHHQDGINRETCQGQILGANLVNNPMLGVLSNNLQDGMRKTRLNNSKLRGGGRCLLNNNLPHGMRKTRLNNNKPQGGAHKTRLRNSLLLGTRLVRQVLEDSNNGTHLLLRLMHGHSLNRVLRNGVNRITNLLHQQRMEMVAVQVNLGHNQLK